MISLLTKFAATAQVTCLTGDQCDTGLPKTLATNDSLKIILQLTFGTIAAVAVIVILLAGLKFITAQGNPQEAAKARTAILYAVIGLVVALSAEALVSFTLGNV